jgi:integrase/recombinase XerC
LPTLFKRSNGIYYFAYDQNGKRRWRSTGERIKALALKVLADFEDGISKPRTRVLLSEFETEFLAYAQSEYRQSTVALYRRTLGQFRATVGDIWFDPSTPREADLYKASRVGDVSSATVNIELRTLRAAFYTALRWKLASENPFKNISLVPMPEQQPTYLSKDEFRKLLSVVSERWLRELFIIAVSTGLRRGELLNLTWNDIDFPRRLLYIHSRDDFRTKLGRRRSVPMGKAVFELLCERSRYRISEYAFSANGRTLDEHWITRKFKSYARKAGLNEKLHFHSLRHTFATWLVQEGVSIYEVQKLLGHSNISVTQVYSQLAASELHSAVNKISVSLN